MINTQKQKQKTALYGHPGPREGIPLCLLKGYLVGAEKAMLSRECTPMHEIKVKVGTTMALYSAHCFSSSACRWSEHVKTFEAVKDFII